ncbi:unnamed protein product [Trifolium pratense]|uniref:Uncharacterized protein n=1 Tax=Trifolium pratense TaxID=57577 RepID=A0ACB0ME86_TRIPR|nr:unnamed protein product [Trifolium pratense]
MSLKVEKEIQLQLSLAPMMTSTEVDDGVFALTVILAKEGAIYIYILYQFLIKFWGFLELLLVSEFEGWR